MYEMYPVHNYVEPPETAVRMEARQQVGCLGRADAVALQEGRPGGTCSDGAG